MWRKYIFGFHLFWQLCGILGFKVSLIIFGSNNFATILAKKMLFSFDIANICFLNCHTKLFLFQRRKKILCVRLINVLPLIQRVTLFNSHISLKWREEIKREGERDRKGNIYRRLSFGWPYNFPKQKNHPPFLLYLSPYGKTWPIASSLQTDGHGRANKRV